MNASQTREATGSNVERDSSLVNISTLGLSDDQIMERVYGSLGKWYSERSPAKGNPERGFISFETDDDWTRAALVAPCHMIFHEIPDHLKTYEVCLANAYDIRIALIPTEHRDEGMYLSAVRCRAYKMADVPEEYRTKEFCLEVLKTDHTAMDFVPDDLVYDPDICLAAATCLKNDPSGDEDRYHYLESDHPRLVDPKMWEIALKQDASLYDWIPQEVRYSHMSDQLERVRSNSRNQVTPDRASMSGSSVKPHKGGISKPRRTLTKPHEIDRSASKITR